MKTDELANEIASGNYGLLFPKKEDARLIAEIIQIISKDNIATNRATYILDTANFSDALFPIIFSIALCGVLSLYLFIGSEISTTKLERQILEYESVHIQKDIKNDIFENSIRMSYNYLDQYYKQTREQAQKGFWITVAISIFGAILIGVGIVSMFAGQTQPSYVTCAVGAITEFISAIFFYLYNKTISSMSQYHNKLVLSQNISIALKVADSLPEGNQAEAKSTIVNELLKDINTYLVEEDTTKK